MREACIVFRSFRFVVNFHSLAVCMAFPFSTQFFYRWTPALFAPQSLNQPGFRYSSAEGTFGRGFEDTAVLLPFCWNWTALHVRKTRWRMQPRGGPHHQPPVKQHHDKSTDGKAREGRVGGRLAGGKPPARSAAALDTGEEEVLRKRSLERVGGLDGHAENNGRHSVFTCASLKANELDLVKWVVVDGFFLPSLVSLSLFLQNTTTHQPNAPLADRPALLEDKKGQTRGGSNALIASPPQVNGRRVPFFCWPSHHHGTSDLC